jgi:two-component system, OmpR family, response regulator
LKILIVDDDPRLRDLVRIALERAGHSVLTARDGKQALVQTAREAPDLVVLDVGLPEMDGFETCRRLRERSEVPILFLTARDDEIDRILGLELGADDYVTKPFSPRELVARVRAILKRSAGLPPAPRLELGALILDTQARICRVAGAEARLTATEFGLLERLLREPARLVPRRELMDAIWGSNSLVSDRTMDSHLRNLRRKLAEVDCSTLVETVHGQGIRLRAGP